jgi:uncharacterized protein with GYD domain
MTTMESELQTEQVTTTVVLPRWLHSGIRSMAEMSDRSFSAEVRQVLVKHLMDAKAEEVAA